jgi:hypothetical protein
MQPKQSNHICTHPALLAGGIPDCNLEHIEISILRPTAMRAAKLFALPDTMPSTLVASLAGICRVYKHESNTSSNSLVSQELS